MPVHSAEFRLVTIPIFLNIFISISFLTPNTRLINAFSHAYSLMLRTFASSSLISLVRISLFFICFSCIFLRNRAMKVFRGTEKTMMATPTNADQPRML